MTSLKSMSFSVFFKHHFKLQNNEALMILSLWKKDIALLLMYNVNSNLDVSFVLFYRNMNALNGSLLLTYNSLFPGWSI